MSKRIVILCEDTQQEVVVRQWLKNRGIGEWVLRVEKNPAGRGSGEHYVRNRYVVEVQECRRQATFSPIGRALIVMIDADIFTTLQRLEQLDRLLVESGLVKRADTERIALLTPKRNIETWIHFMHGNPVNEDTAYAKLRNPGDCRTHVRHFLANHPNQPPADAPDSLAMAYQELQRIL